ncbi:cryptochrome-1 isoform X2 [Parasteatoda tepidariorum]|uniref:cryptochrome-1 isoform X2 n=1 Tax=Parasteatoda tepidariorum TaxID=114398 RepID=UPI001C721804|nr:cryptochrome-1 isoform X2 [Parasteatoda tepidariorum]XP_042901353.1 cryptochrome-1 isoform X2 [Parasteatoda tepidariorum]
MSHENAIHWFRKCLRIHDNPALLEAIKNSKHFWPIFILDPWFVKNMKCGPNRWRFLAQSLQDLDDSLRKFNSRLFVIRGKPMEVFPQIVRKWKIKLLTFESDTEPYAKVRDEEIHTLMKILKVEVCTFSTNTIYNPEKIIEFNGKVPLTMQAYLNIVDKIGLPAKPVQSEEKIIQLTSDKERCSPLEDISDSKYDVPTLEELGVKVNDLYPCLYPGGETEALKRLERSLSNEQYVCKFSKPDTFPNSIKPSTTVLSPYVKFGCLSARTFYYKIRDVYLKSKSGYTKPPVSLHGQLFWREFFYTVGSVTPHFDQMIENSVCRQIPWMENKEHLEAWAHGRTGYPFIDAIMTQLRQEGWVHHLARHAVACFLTRGDLWISWEHGMKVFEELLLDADWSLNAGNWMWLSASAFFHQYYRVYSPIAFGKKTDKNGDYIRKYVPILKRFPPEYIYEPWKAPKKLQEQLGCVIGKDYPSPIVDHDKARVENLRRMDAVYKSAKESGGKKSASPKKSQKQSPKASSSHQTSALSSTPKSTKRANSQQQNKITKFLKLQ